MPKDPCLYRRGINRFLLQWWVQSPTEGHLIKCSRRVAHKTRKSHTKTSMFLLCSRRFQRPRFGAQFAQALIESHSEPPAAAVISESFTGGYAKKQKTPKCGIFASSRTRFLFLQTYYARIRKELFIDVRS